MDKTMMKVAQITDRARIEYVDAPRPEPAEDEVLVRVALTGICGSDVPRYLDGQVHTFPQVLGHEFSGTVVEVGTEADPGLLGKRIAGIPLVPCMKCESCSSGDYALCGSYSFIGTRQQGSMAQYIAVPQTNVMAVDERVDALTAAFFEPATVALHAIDIAGLATHPQARIAVIGAGTIGIFLTQATKAYAPDEVVLFNRTQRRLDVAQAAGVEDVFNLSDPSSQELLRQIALEHPFTHVFDAVGVSETIALAFQLADTKAEVCFVGTPKSPIALTAENWELLNRKELSVKGSWMSYSSPWPGSEWRRASDFFASGTLSVVDEMIDTIYPLPRVCEAFERFRDPSTVHGKLLIDSLELML